jgi:hypothetical protein
MFDYNEYLLEQESYLEQNAKLFTYTNPHPNNKVVGDCVKRAIALCGDKDYNETSLELNRYKKFTKSKTYNERKNWVSYIEKVMRWQKLDGYQNVKVCDFAKQNPKGTYLIKVRGHVTTVKDGLILDTWHCGFKAINRVWQVK